MTKPISSAAFELAKLANGGDYDAVAFQKGTRFTSVEGAQDILDLTKTALAKDANDELEKTVTISTGLTTYNLRAPSLLFQPVITPVRNNLRRNQLANPGPAANWKSINGLNYTPNWMGWVPEGRRAGSITYSASPASASYATMGVEDSITDEAKFAAQGYEDEEALIQLRSLYKLMVIEEANLLWGNASSSLAAPATPTVSASGSGNTLPTATYSVICVALTGVGYLNATRSGTLSLLTPQSIASNDGNGSFTLNGGSGPKSTAASQAITLGQQLNASVTPVSGAVAYAWYVGTAGSEKLEAITTISSAVFTKPLAGTGQAASAITADWSTNTNGYDGLITQTFKNTSTAYINVLPTGVAGQGTQLTAVGDGEIAEIRTMLRAMWDTYQISISKLYVSSQELASITKLALAGGSTPIVRLNTTGGSTGPADVKYTAGAVVGYYYNPYSPEGGKVIPIILHPSLTPGTIFGYAETLPAAYMSNETPTVAELLVRQDYYVEKWPKTTRTQFYGTYCQSVPAVYAPFCLAAITNIAPTP